MIVRIRHQRLYDCGLAWECMLLGMDYTSPPLCLELDQRVTVTLRVHVLVIVRVV